MLQGSDVSSPAGASASTATEIDYPLGSTDRERQRLIAQARLLHDLTLEALRNAGILPGMRVLDIGCGSGDVAMLAADLAGNAGSVVAIDRDPANLAFARERAEEASYTNIEFREADIATFADVQPFDALIGRYILLYIPDPVAALRSLIRSLRPGGMVCMIEPDFSAWLRSFPEVPLFQQTVEAIYAAVRASGMHTDSALALHKHLLDAGLTQPALVCRQLVGGGPDYAMYKYVAETLRSVMPALQQYGIAVSPDLRGDTLAQRIEAQAVATRSVLISYPIVSAWAAKP